MEFVDLKFKTSSCRIYKFGATITDWSIGDKKIIFVSPKAVFDGKKAIRGGVPICFPSFGPWSYGAQHGFARTSNFQVSVPATETDTETSITFRLSDSEESRKIWDMKFVLDYKVVLKADDLCLDLDLKNTGEVPFSFTTALHTYFNVDAVDSASVTGLTGLKYLDKTLPGVPTLTEDRDEVSLSGWTDRVYLGPCPPVTVRGVAGGSLCLISANLPDTVVWNPWKEKAEGMSDLGGEAWSGFLCVEAGQCVAPVELGPAKSWIAKHQMSFSS